MSVDNCEKLCPSCPLRSRSSRVLLKLFGVEGNACDSGPVVDLDPPTMAVWRVYGAAGALKYGTLLCGRTVPPEAKQLLPEPLHIEAGVLDVVAVNPCHET